VDGTISDDLRWVPPQSGRRTILDVTVVDSVVVSYIAQLATIDDSAAEATVSR
jgi:hypothetical protein